MCVRDGFVKYLSVECTALCPSHLYPACVSDGLWRFRKWEVILLPGGAAGALCQKGVRVSHLSKTGEAWPHPWAGGWSLHDVTFLSPMKPGQQRRTGLVSRLCSWLLAAGDGVSVSRTERRASGCMVQALLLAERGLRADLAHVVHGDAEQERPSDFSSS